MANEFKGRVVAVTGAAGTLGRAVANAFRCEGARLILIDMDVSKLEEANGPVSHDQDLLEVDLVNQERAAEKIGEAIARAGGIDVLCNIAGGFMAGTRVHEYESQAWRGMIDANVATLITAVHAAAPVMIGAGSGRIVNIGAAAAVRGMAGMGIYTASKSAVIRLTEAMSAELRDQGISVNCALPSIIDTPANRTAMPEADHAKWVSPASMADVILFLASERARDIHGAALPVTGLS